jgi:hypothetical protein
MPVIISAMVSVTMVRMNDNGTVWYANIQVMNKDNPEVPYVMLLTLWVDEEKDVVIPNSGGVYYLDGKLSFSSDEKCFIVEAIRFHEWNDSVIPVPARITCCVTVTQKSEIELIMSAAAYACRTQATLQIVGHFNHRQYRQTFESMNVPSLLHVSGCLGSIDDKDRLILKDLHLSFASMRGVSSPVQKKSPKWWKNESSPKKIQSISDDEVKKVPQKGRKRKSVISEEN